MQWWIDTVGKLGPGLIALLVLLTTRSQNRALNAVTSRAARVEDQKLRLALLDRRLQAVDAVRDAVGHYQISGQPDGEARGKLIDALRVAEVVFSDEDERAIAEIILNSARWSSLNRRLERTRSDDERNKLIDQLVELDAGFDTMTRTLVERLLTATRVSDVPPLAWPRSIVSRTWDRCKSLAWLRR
ncbi:hypothetical protein [Sphingomonas aquatilis]|uniref:hypothetical protein n=1 Tax=Sphingomonas aquatilis TaxID=93063 RepID=UPI0023F6B82A|nr:hypothetical protein [Sphingomonas aquatilis]MCI4653140.1 hypothetical protein [Sphingomonas aquatilis]